MSQEVEELLGRLEGKNGVVGAIVVNKEGIAIKSTLDNATTVQYAGLMSKMAEEAALAVDILDPENELTCIRLRSNDHEVIIEPEKDYILIVIQKPVN